MTLERHQIAWWTAGSFAILATLITMVQVAYHLQWTTHKYIRRYVIRIIIMVPIYSLESWLGLRFKDQAMYFALLRECYEALVIYSFYQLLVTWLGGEEKLTVMLAEKPTKAHMTPFCCLRPWSMTNGAENPSEMHSDFFLYTQIGTLQYCIMKPLLGLIAFICEINHVYEDGKFLPDKGWPYVTFFANMSQVWAMYCLIMFYMVFKDDLRPIRPIPKFLVVKAVVFFTFWQGVLLAILVRVGLLTPTETYTEDEIVSGLQDFIVCMEMTIAAIAHHFAFTHKDFVDPSAPATRAPVLRAVFEVVNVTDVYVNEVRKVTKRVTKKNATRTVTSSASSALGPTSPSNPYVALTEPLTDTPGADEQQQQQQQQHQHQHGAVHIHVMESGIESRTRNGSHHRLIHTESLSVEWDGSMNGDPNPNSRRVADDDDDDDNNNNNNNNNNDTRYRQHMTLPSLTSDEPPLVEL